MKKLVIILGLLLSLMAMNPGRSQTIAVQKGTGTIQRAVVDIAMTDVWVEQCRVWVRYANTGTVKIDKLLRENVWVDNVLQVSQMEQVVLNPGDVFAHGVGSDPGLKISGSKGVKAMIDADGVLTEPNKANNTKEVTLNCLLHVIPGGVFQLKPDLIVAMDFKQMTHNDSSGQMVYSCDIQFTVTNQGGAEAGACKIYLERDSGPGGSFAACGPEISVPAISAHQSTIVMSGPYKHTGPPPTYRATVDYHNVVIESNENNNTATKKFPG